MGALLIAGPVGLDDLPGQTGLIGGAGAYAAIAAAPLAPTQLWARAGTSYDQRLRGILERRGIDLSGLGEEGPTARSGAVTGTTGSVLPEVEPTTAEDLGAILLIDLPPTDLARALARVRSLPGAEERPLIIAPAIPPGDGPPGDLSWAPVADVLILPARLVGEDPLATATAQIGRGTKAVVLTAGIFGGIMIYQGRTTSYPAVPVRTVDHTGTGATFAGVLAAWCAGPSRCDLATLQRGLSVASAVAAACSQGLGPKRLLTLDRAGFMDAFNRLRRATKI